MLGTHNDIYQIGIPDFEVNLILSSGGGERSNNCWDHIIGRLPTWTNCSCLAQETVRAETILNQKLLWKVQDENITKKTFSGSWMVHI